MLSRWLPEGRRHTHRRLTDESRIVQTLNDVSQKLSAELDTQTLVQAITDAGTELTHAAFGAFFYNVIDADGESYMLYTLSGAPVEAFSKFGLPRNTEVFAPTFTGSEVVRSPDITQDPRYGKMAPHYGMPKGHLPVRSYLAASVKSRSGEVLGGLFFGHPDKGQFSELDERLVVGIATHAAIAIDNARLYASERQAREASEKDRKQLATLAAASKVLAPAVDPEETLRAFAQVVAHGHGGVCIVDIIDPLDGAVWRISVDAENPSEPTASALLDSRPATESAYLATAPAELIGDGDAAGRTATVSPIRGRHERLGALWLVSGERGRRLGAEDLEFTQELSRRVAVALEHARLYARQRSVAQTLQHSLIPERLPDIPGLSLAARYVAAGPEVEVGGDWYDVLHLEGTKVALVMGDVAGRGTKAAALMGQLRNAVRAYALDGKSPSELMQALNGTLVDAADEEMATVIYAVLDLTTNELRLVNAGHPPPLLHSSEGRASYLEGEHGLPLGGIAHAKYPEVTAELRPGETLLLYTDGLVESRHLALEDGMDHLRDAVQEGPEEVDDLCAHLVTDRLATEGHADDVAVLALRLQPLGSRLHLRVPSNPQALAPLRAALRRWLEEVGATDDEIDDLLVAAGETATNAIRHAHGPRESMFELEATAADDVLITVRDTGTWRERSSGEGGLGLRIVESCVDGLEIHRQERGTEVRMIRRLSDPTTGEEAGAR